MTSIKHPSGIDTAPDVLARIVHRHAHDVRNHLNILELEAVMLSEVTSDPAGVATIRRMRAQLTQLDNTVKALLFKFTEPRPAVVTAGDLLQLWKCQITPLLSAEQRMEWPAVVENRQLNVDASVVVFVLRELTIAAWNRARGTPLKASLRGMDDAVVIELREPAHEVPMTGDAMEAGAKLVHANGGRLDHTQIPATGEWITSLTFPGYTP